MDLREWLADRSRWGELLHLIDQLPYASRTRQAIVNDPDIARELLEAENDSDGSESSRWSPSVSEWTTDVAATAAVFDRLGLLIDLVSAALGSKGGRSQEFPRPETEIDRIKAQLRREAAEELIALFGGRRPK